MFDGNPHAAIREATQVSRAPLTLLRAGSVDTETANTVASGERERTGAPAVVLILVLDAFLGTRQS